MSPFKHATQCPSRDRLRSLRHPICQMIIFVKKKPWKEPREIFKLCTIVNIWSSRMYWMTFTSNVPGPHCLPALYWWTWNKLIVLNYMFLLCAIGLFPQRRKTNKQSQPIFWLYMITMTSTARNIPGLVQFVVYVFFHVCRAFLVRVVVHTKRPAAVLLCYLYNGMFPFQREFPREGQCCLSGTYWTHSAEYCLAVSPLAPQPPAASLPVPSQWIVPARMRCHAQIDRAKLLSPNIR